ncbi:MAG: cysteine hydrolase [Caulobacteraceae bacterium]|nr:cysteine hydrolase [Caulobacteraceae bacterium]
MHVSRLPRWAAERGAAVNSFPTLAPGRTALVNIDMQSVFLAEDQIYGNAHARDIVGAVNALSAAMRSVGAPVIWTRNTYTSEGPCAPPPWQYDPEQPGVAEGMAALRAGSPSHGLYAGMQVAESDIVLDKYRYGALSCPAGNLRRTLEALGTEMVVITGTLTNCCCESTAREANMAGYKVIAVPNAMASVTDAEHNAALLNLRLNFADVRRVKHILSVIETARSPA